MKVKQFFFDRRIAIIRGVSKFFIKYGQIIEYIC